MLHYGIKFLYVTRLVKNMVDVMKGAACVMESEERENDRECYETEPSSVRRVNCWTLERPMDSLAVCATDLS